MHPVEPALGAISTSLGLSPGTALVLLLILSGAALGAAAGSFGNVCQTRWRVGGSVLKPRGSQCPQCHLAIPFFRNIPLVSYILQGGRCACRLYHIPPRYLLWEICGFFLGGALGGILSWVLLR
jgi:prepilin signal peptidase PulO-like enzyme (type II secretory pathway)